jgi:chemotaxis receptor (MCP) glutamine deamidase CheD
LVFQFTHYPLTFQIGANAMADTVVKVAKFEMASKGLLKIEQIGAGVGVVIHSSANSVGAGLHILGPHTDSKGSNPIMYANTAIPYALEQLEKNGVKAQMTIAIAGGASMLGQQGAASVGPKVTAAVKDALKKAHLTVKIDETGGPKVRSMILNIDTGKIEIV